MSGPNKHFPDESIFESGSLKKEQNDVASQASLTQLSRLLKSVEVGTFQSIMVIENWPFYEMSAFFHFIF